MKKILALIFLALIYQCSFAASLNSEIQSVIDNDRVKYHLIGISVSLKLPNENKIRNFVSGYTTQDKNKKITSTTLFQIGSITKTFTATILMELVENHKIKLDDTINKWLPQYPKWKNITIKQLLNHTSGIYNFTANDELWKSLKNHPQKKWSMTELTDMAYQHHLLFTAGQHYQYSNTDYVLLGLIIENAAHQPIQQIFNDYLKKYKLKNTYYAPYHFPDGTAKRMAHGYDEENTFGVNQDTTFYSMSYGHTSGSMMSTSDDLISWLNQLFSGKIISNQSLATMMNANHYARICLQKRNFSAPMSEFNLSSLGMGLLYFKNYGFTWAHAGGVPNGYESFFTYNPCKDIYLVVLYNKKPKQQLLFTVIENDIFTILDKSKLVKKYVKTFQENNRLPNFCHCH